MTELTRQRHSRPQSLSAPELIARYERAIHDAVEATLILGLQASHASAATRERVAATWREPLTIVAAEALSHQLAGKAAGGRGAGCDPSGLRRIMRVYAPLVTTAACAEQMAEPSDFVAAD